MGNGISTYFKSLSPTKVNAFLDWRSKWFLEDILKRRLPGSPEMHRGNAVENGIAQFLIGNLSLEDTQAYAASLFKEATADLDVDDSAAAGEPISALVATGIEALKPYGKLVSVQRKVNASIPDTILDWFGKADFEFEGGVVVDLKVTGKTPSEMSGGHSRQGSFYQTFIPGCARVDFLYLIPLKKGINQRIHTVADAGKHIHNLRMGAIAMNKILSISDDPSELKEFFLPAPDDWWLKDPLALSTASEVWGISHFEPKQEAPKEIAA